MAGGDGEKCQIRTHAPQQARVWLAEYQLLVWRQSLPLHAVVRSAVGLSAGRLDDLAVALRVALDHGIELLGCRGDEHHALRLEP